MSGDANPARESRLAAELLAAHDAAGLIDLPSRAEPPLDVDVAWRVADALMRLRLGRGERRVGWKIGFTNRGIWDRYGVHAPIWGPVWDGTATDLGENDGADGDARGGDGDLGGDGERRGPAGVVSLRGLVQPRLEPEVMFGFASAPEPGMDERALAGCIEWVAHGFEIVQTHYAGWRFTLPDTIADFALHGRLLVGRRVPMAAFAEPAAELAALSVELFEGERLVERGEASIVLGGPLTALRIWLDAMAGREPRWRVEAGDIVSTGTITDAAPLAPGQHWRTRLSDARLPGVSLRTEA